MTANRYAVPLSELDTQVPVGKQSTEQAEPRLEAPVPWALGAGAVPAADGGGGDGD